MVATLPDLGAHFDADLMCPAAPTAAERDSILVVEDQEPVAALIACILERGGFRVVRATTAREALRQYSAEPARFVLAMLDSTLPDGDGATLARQLRFVQRDLPLLFVTGRDLVKLRADFAGAFTGFLPKPFLPADILREVRMLAAATV